MHGRLTDSDFAADLAQVLRGDAPPEYSDPALFFANTHPTEGLKELLRIVCNRLNNSAEQLSPIVRLDTIFGGGKTHSLIALVHAARGMHGVTHASEFLDPALLPSEEVTFATFDGENASPFDGRDRGNGVKAYTPWGEIAYALSGKEGYEKVRKSDEAHGAPGADTLQSFFSGKPTLILIDELSIYLRKQSHQDPEAEEQLTAFMSALFKAVESSPRVALVYTLAIGKNSQTSNDAYAKENEIIAKNMQELERVSARKATLLDPTKEDETVKVLCRRLFKSIRRDKP